VNVIAARGKHVRSNYTTDGSGLSAPQLIRQTLALQSKTLSVTVYLRSGSGDLDVTSCYHTTLNGDGSAKMSYVNSPDLECFST
jgi:hypothetical protein